MLVKNVYIILCESSKIVFHNICFKNFHKKNKIILDPDPDPKGLDAGLKFSDPTDLSVGLIKKLGSISGLVGIDSDPTYVHSYPKP